MPDLLPYLTALLLGLLHSIDLDHAIAVSAFVTAAPSFGTALGFGLRWGLGHSATVLALGAALIFTGFRLGPGTDVWAERLVGLALVAVGLWSFRAVRNLHLHLPPAHGDHAHLHEHRSGHGPHEHVHGHAVASDRRHHPRGVAWLGVLHGVAGSSAALALVPVTMIEDPGAGIGYLLLFSAGVTLGMMTFAVILARALGEANSRSVTWGRRIGRAVALASMLIGGWWVMRT